MKKRIFKVFIMCVSLCLVLGALLGISAFASESAEPEAQSDVTPYIMSKNVSYSSNIYIYYAVPKASIPEGSVPKLVGTDANGDFVINEYDEDTVLGVECYIFITRGVAAKDLNVKESVKVVAGDKESETVEYSVEQYIYEKLYHENYISKIEADGKDFTRRKLYFNLLEYGAIAQSVLDVNAEDRIAGDNYVAIKGSSSLSTGSVADGDSIYLKADVVAGKKFSYWEVGSSDDFGASYEKKLYGDCTTIDFVDKNYRIVPVYDTWGVDGIEYPTTVTFGEMPDTSIASFNLGAAGNAEILDSFTDKNGVTKNGVLKITKPSDTASANGVNYYQYATDYTVGGDTVVWEADVYASNGYAEITIGDKAKGKDGILTIRGTSGSDKYYEDSERVAKADLNTWFRMSITYTVKYDEELGYDVYICTLRLNDTESVYTGKATVKIGEITSLRYYMTYNSQGLYFDNIKFTIPKFNVVDFSGTPADTNCFVNSVPDATYGTAEIPAVSYPEEVSDGTITHYNVLEVNKQASKSGAYIKFNPTDTAEPGANAWVFECDYMYVSGNSLNEITINGHGLIFDTGAASRNANKWTKLRIVYKMEDDGKTKGYIYINDALITTSPEARRYDTSLDLVSGITLKFWTAPGHYYMDNVTFNYVYLAD